jgi:putative effector of murein hydrolase
VSGFLFTLLTTAVSVVGIRKLFNPSSTTEQGTTDNVDDMTPTPLPITTTTTTTTSLPFSKSLLYQFRIIMAVTGILFTSVGKTITGSSGPLLSMFFLATTLHNFCWGARLNKKITKVVHPLVTCTTLTWAWAAVLAKLSGRTFRSMLQSYKVGAILPLSHAGPGDVLLFLLGPAVVSLAISMYDRRQLMKDNWKEVVTGVGISSTGGLFGTAMMVRALRLASPALRLSLLSRNITSPLAMAIASILGADVGLAVAMVVVTGLLGANFGASILSTFGIQDPVARGMGIGAAAHGLGTAAFVNEKDAFPFAAISMALTASACTCLVSVPMIKKAVIQLALGV